MNRRFLWLDGSRGVAAIIVMIYHFREYLLTGSLFHASYLAVDLFFMMSGFVLAHAYGPKLRDRMSFTRFLLIRMIRLYPAYAFATMIGLAYYVAKIAMRTDDAPDALDLIATAVLNFCLIPNLDPRIVPAGLFPFAPTSWSLAAEMFVSVLFGTMFYRLRAGTNLVVLIVASAAFVLFAVQYRTVDVGWSTATFAPSLFRATAEFVAGMLIYTCVPTLRTSPIARWISAATFVVVIGVMVVMPARLDLSLITICVVFPAAIFLQARSEPEHPAAWLCHQLGRGSYPIYLLHTPMLLWGVGLAKLVAPNSVASFGLCLGLALIVLTLVVSYGAAALVDEPIRRMLSRWIGRRYPIDPVSRS